MQRITHADLRPDADVLVLYEDSWWSGRVTRIRRGRVEVDCDIMGAVISHDVSEREVAMRLEPGRHAAPLPGTPVLAAENHAAFTGPRTLATKLGWRRARVLAARDADIDVQFTADRHDRHDEQAARHPLPLEAIAHLFGHEEVTAPAEPEPGSEAEHERVHGVVRRVDGDGPVLVAAAIYQHDQVVAPRRILAEAFVLERADGSRVAVQVDGAWPRISPARERRGGWDELRADPLATMFTDFAPGPHEDLVLAGEVVLAGDVVEIVGPRAPARSDAAGGAVDFAIRPASVAVGDAAAVNRQLEPPAPATASTSTSGVSPATRSRADLWLLAPLVLALPGVYLWYLGLAGAGGSWISTLLAIAVYQHRSAHPLTRFHRRRPGREAPFHLAGVSDRNNDSGLLAIYVILLCAGGPLVAVLAFGMRSQLRTAAWVGLAAAAVWAVVLALVLRWREAPQARVLWIFLRAGRHGAPEAWGVTTGTVRAGELTRRIDMHGWTTSHTVAESVATTGGGATQVHREVTRHHSVGARSERAPDTLELSTAQGPTQLRGCKHAVWGTSRPVVEAITTGTARARIVERIGPGDAVAVYGRVQGPVGARSIDHTDPGSLMIFGAGPGDDPMAALRGRLAAHVLSLALIVAALIPALIAALTTR